MIEYNSADNITYGIPTATDGNGQQQQQVQANQFTPQPAQGSFSSTGSLGLNSQYQHHPQRRNDGFGNPNYGGGIMSDSYGPLQLGNYEPSDIMDWNNGARSLSVIDSQFSIPQANSGIFQQVGANPPDWTSGLRGVQVQSDSLGLQLNNNSQQSYNLNDLTQYHSQQIALGVSAQQQQQQQQQPRVSAGSRYNTTGNPGNNSPRQYGGGPPQPNLGNPGTGGSNAQGRALNKMLLDILRDRNVDPNRLAMAIDANIERMDCVNLATLLFHTGKKRLLLTPSFIKRIAIRFSMLKEELRAREASNALYGLKCMSSEVPEVRQLVFALASKLSASQTELVAQAVGNALYGCQMMTSEHEEVRYMLHMLSIKIAQCTELLEAQNVGNALYGLRGMNSDCKEVRMLVAAITPKVASAREELNGQALGNSLYGLQGMNSREPEIRNLLNVLAVKVTRTWEDLKAQEVGNALYGLKRMNSDVTEVRNLVEALVPKVASSPEILDAQAIGNSFYGMQNMKSDNPQVLALLATMADKVMLSPAELDGQAMGNSLYGLQGMKSEHLEVRAVVNAITMKIQSSSLEMNAQELGNAMYGLQGMTCDHSEVRRLLAALTQKVSTSKHELTSQEIGNALFGLQCMKSDCREVRQLIRQVALKIQQSTSLIDPQGIANSLFGLQHMTSESEEIKLLLTALAGKIEHSWKVLTSQHVSNSLFGLQNLCSAETEVRGLIHALVPKILASRDEMTPKQICIAMYGLRNLFSHHDEVRALLGPLVEKLNLCTQPIPLQLLSLAFFGLQGMDTVFEEVRTLLMILCEKLANVDEIDAFSVANILFGLQRMSSTYVEAQNALELLSPMVMTLADAGLEIGAQVCANLIYGLQNSNCGEESVRRILFVALSFSKDLIARFTIPQNLTGLVEGAPTTSNVQDILCLHQALSLTQQVIPGLHMDTDLHTEMRSQQEQLYRVIELRKLEVAPYKLSTAEKRLADSITDVLTEEPFVVSYGELLHGFEACIVIRLRPGLNLVATSGVEWAPILNIEVAGPKDICPKNELFSRLRAQYLFQEMGVVVQTIPYSSLAGQSRASLRELLRRTSDLFTAIYPPTVEDAANFNTILLNMGLIKGNGLLSSLNSDSRFSNGENSLNPDSGSSFFCLGNNDGLVNGINDFDPTLSDENVDYYESRLQNRSTLRHSFGMLIGWIGDLPVVSITPHNTPCNSPTMNYSANPSSKRSLASKTYKNASSPSVVSPGHSSRSVYPPFVQIGPPVHSGSGPGPTQSALPAMSILPTTSRGSSKQGYRPSQVSYRQSLGPSTNDQSYNGGFQPPSGINGGFLTPGVSPRNGHGINLEDSADSHGDGDTINIEETTEVDSEIALLEAQLEIKRLEAKLLLLKKIKAPLKGASPGGSGNGGGSTIDSMTSQIQPLQHGVATISEGNNTDFTMVTAVDSQLASLSQQPSV